MLAAAERDTRKAGTIWALNLDWSLPEVEPLVPARFRQAGPDSARLLAAAMGLEDPAEVVRRFEAGRRCYTAWVDGELASYGWVSFDDELVGELNLRLRLVPGEAYIWDCATLPDFRQKRLYSALLGFILAELQTDPLCRAWIGANQDNLASQRGIAHAGFRRVGDLLVERALGLRLVRVQGQRDVPEHLVADARRVFLSDRDRPWREALATFRRSCAVRPGAHGGIKYQPTHPSKVGGESPRWADVPGCGSLYHVVDPGKPLAY